jgi:hypothetical protein
MRRFPPAARVGIVLGLWFIMQRVRAISRAVPALQIPAMILGWLYVLFCTYTWTAEPLFRYFVRRKGGR